MLTTTCKDRPPTSTSTISQAETGWVELAAKAVHYVLYGLLATEAAPGFVLRWSGNEATRVFGLLIPPPLAPFSKPAH